MTSVISKHTRIARCMILPLLLLAGCPAPGGFKITPIPADQTLEEHVVHRDKGFVTNRIAILDISGVLMNTRTRGLLSEGENPVSMFVEKLAAAREDDRVKAVIIRVNSPGGTVTASDTLYQEILAFRKKTGKPVIAFFQDVAASGGYYLSCAADEIMAQRTSVTGSIGVIMQMFNFSGSMAKLGMSADAITSGPHKDTGTPFRPMRPEERELFQKLVDDFYEQFVQAVAAGRPKLTVDQVRTLADGRVYNADQALAAGLIDKIGTLHDAIDEAKKRAQITSALAVAYRRPGDWAPNIHSQAPNPEHAQTLNLFNVTLPDLFTSEPRFMYIWMPGR